MIKGELHPYQTGVRIRNTKKEDIHKIIELQKESFPLLAKYGNIWHEEELQDHLNIFSDGQFVAEEPDGTIVGSASTLIVSLNSCVNTSVVLNVNCLYLFRFISFMILKLHQKNTSMILLLKTSSISLQKNIQSS